MNTERMMQVCVAMMAALATLMLGTSQESATLPIIGLLAALTALFFTDILKWFSLHPIVAGTAGVVAGANAFIQSQTGGLESQFISVANLLIHLQIVLLFQKKTQRIYWQLITLSLLQVVVAAALNLFVLFGPLLILYTCFAISALLLFFVYRQVDTFLVAEDQVSMNVDQSIQIASAQPFGTPTSSSAVDPLNRPRRTLLKASFFRYFTLMGISTALVSAAVFLLMPRFGDDAWRAKTKSATGLSEEEVNLTNVSSIYEDPSVLMRVSFLDEATNEPYSVSGYPYFRGAVHEVYRNGKWKRDDSGELERSQMSRLKTPTRIYSAVRQQIHLEVSRGNTVCGVSPSCGLNDATDSLRMCDRTLEVRHFSDNSESPLEYTVGTLGFRNGLQSEFLPNYGTAKALTNEAVTNQDRMQEVLNYLPALSAKAAEIVADIPEDQILRRARALERHFTNGRAGYKYSLDPSPERDPKRWRDPVEDFVMNHKTGHCQFFASALALMLRSQGIPARIVVGFRADSYNVVGGYYQLRGMDAHAWVEAAIPADQIPDDEVMPTEGLRGFEANGAWVRLDPTSGDDFVNQSVAVSAWRQQLSDSVDYMQLLWSEYVLGLNEKRQRKAIYEPIKNAIKNTFALAFSREVWTARFEAIRERFQGDFFTRQNMRDAAIAIVVLTIAFYVIRYAGRFLWGWTKSVWNRSEHRHAPKIEFYRRLESILSKHGIHRELTQTPSEFAALAKLQLLDRNADSTTADIPSKVVQHFYRVRFGDDRLDTNDLQRLENWLGSLQKSLSSTS